MADKTYELVFKMSDGSTERVQFIAPQGPQGDKPVKGTDYFTAADQKSIVQEVIAALGTPVFGRVDEENNIILSGELAEGTYTLKYEDEEGNVTVIGTLTADAGAPNYTNVLPLAINSDRTAYNGGKGWKTGYRLNSSGVETAMDGMEVTGFIPVKYGDIVRLKNVGWPVGASQTYAWAYDENFNGIAYVNAASASSIVSGFAEFDSENNLIQFEAAHNFFVTPKDTAAAEINNKIAYFRINCADITDESIITVNQEIA